MATKVEIPVVGEDVDPTDPAGTIRTVVMSSVGVAIMFGVFALGQWLWNQVAGNTPDVAQEVEVI